MTLSGLVVAVVAIIVGVAQPEVRCFVGLQSESCPSSQTNQTSPGEPIHNDEQPKSSPPISTIEPSPKSSPREPIQNDEQAKSPPSVSPSQPRTSLISKARGWWSWVIQVLGKWLSWLIVGVVGIGIINFIIVSIHEHISKPKYRTDVDYTNLRDLLAAQKWKEADQETARVMCQAASRQEEGWLRIEDIDNFPCEDLRTINQLWLHYSDGKFGFSVQKEIYENLGGTREYNEEVWRFFGDGVGWRSGRGSWLREDELIYKKSAPRGHLPYDIFIQLLGFGREHEKARVGSLLSRKDL